MSTGGTLFWAAVCVAGIALVAPDLTRVEERPPPTARVEGDESRDDEAGDDSPERAGNGVAGHALERSPDGHFYAEAQVNGSRIRFLVDTGASFVALTPRDAQAAGIVLGSERATARGAGGEVEVIPVVVDRIALGPLTATDVRGAVVEDLSVSLLGQSFLSRADSVEIRGDEMMLR
jgi:aspartyl protease family protein